MVDPKQTVGPCSHQAQLYCISHAMAAVTKVFLHAIIYLLIYTNMCIIWIVYVHAMCSFAGIGLIFDWYHLQTCFCAFLPFITIFPLCVTVTPIPHSSNTTLHPSFHSVTTDTRECDNIPGITCQDLAALGNSERSSSCL